MPIHFLPQLCAADSVEPEPQKQSITIEFFAEDVSMMKRSISMFFCVG